MYAHNRPIHLVRALSPPRFAAGVLVTLALLSAACNDSASRIIAPSQRASMHKSPSAAVSSAPSLGTASSFAVLGASTVTCTNASAVTGDVGVSPGIAITGFNPDCTTTGTIHAGDAVAFQAHNDLVIAYAAAAGMACPTANNLTGADLGTLPGPLLPGVYCFNSSVGLTGQLVLDARGDPNAVWVFQIGSTITTATNSSVLMINGGQPCNVFWAVGSSATIGLGTAFQGNILAATSITLVNGANLVGRALARDAAVTMDHNTVSIASCGAVGPPPSCKEPGDRVTGGGWITARFGAKANFAVSGGIDIKKNAFQGHLEYDDKGVKGKSDDVKVQGTGVTAYIVLDAVTRRIEGTANVDGKAGFTYRVDVSDNGEPGRNKGGNDQFAIGLWNASGALIYSASGTLGGGNIQLHGAHGRACVKDGHDKDLSSKNWKVYNIDAATSKWDINKAAALPGGVVQFPFQRFVSMTSGSFAVYLLNNYHVDMTDKTISADVAWDKPAGISFVTRGPAEDGAYVRIVFRDVGSGSFVSNDYWWSSVRLDLNGGTSGTLTAALTARTLWSNICGQLATDQTAHPGPNCTGGTDPAVSPYDGFTNAMKNVKEVGLSFGRASRFASGVAVIGGPSSFRLNSFTITP